MKRLKGLPRGKTVSAPIAGPADINAGIQAAIGGLVIAWANAESVFLALLQLLMKETERTAGIVWYSLRTTQARLDLVTKLARERFEDGRLAKEIEERVNLFKGPSGTRNFFCHATYGYAENMQLSTVHGVSLAQDGSPLRFTNKWLDLAAMNEIGSATVDLINLNADLWETVERVETELGVQREERPQLPPDAPLGREIDPPIGREPRHQDPPDPSAE